MIKCSTARIVAMGLGFFALSKAPPAQELIGSIEYTGGGLPVDIVSVAGGADYDNDGYDDLVLANQVGRSARIYFGHPDGGSLRTSETWLDADPGSDFGYATLAVRNPSEASGARSSFLVSSPGACLDPPFCMDETGKVQRFFFNAQTNEIELGGEFTSSGPSLMGGPRSTDYYGVSLETIPRVVDPDLDGDFIAIGCISRPGSGATDPGYVHIYDPGSISAGPMTYITPPPFVPPAAPGTGYQGFGVSLSSVEDPLGIDPADLLIGNVPDPVLVAGGPPLGAVYGYDLAGTLVRSVNGSLAVNTGFGFSIASLADSTGDGIAEMGIGASSNNSIRIISGAIGVPGFTAGVTTALIVGEEPFDSLNEVWKLGDVDSDGVNDYIVFASGDNPNELAAGAVGSFRVHSGADNSLLWVLSSKRDRTPNVPGAAVNSLSGAPQFAGDAGDWNNDGIDDFFAVWRDDFTDPSEPKVIVEVYSGGDEDFGLPAWTTNGTVLSLSVGGTVNYTIFPDRIPINDWSGTVEYRIYGSNNGNDPPSELTIGPLSATLPLVIPSAYTVFTINCGPQVNCAPLLNRRGVLTEGGPPVTASFVWPAGQTPPLNDLDLQHAFVVYRSSPTFQLLWDGGNPLPLTLVP